MALSGAPEAPSNSVIENRHWLLTYLFVIFIFYVSDVMVNYNGQVELMDFGVTGVLRCLTRSSSGMASLQRLFLVRSQVPLNPNPLEGLVRPTGLEPAVGFRRALLLRVIGLKTRAICRTLLRPGSCILKLPPNTNAIGFTLHQFRLLAAHLFAFGLTKPSNPTLNQSFAQNGSAQLAT